MDYLNSQNLTSLDGYYHVFSAVDSWTWGIGSVGSFQINVVSPPLKTPQPHDIVLQFDPGTQTYVISPTNQSLTINQNDYILWYCDSSSGPSPPFAVLGSSKGGDSFNSRSLGDDDAYSHLFMLPGTYQYVIGGGPSGPVSATILANAATSGTAKAWLISIDFTKNPNPNPVNLTLNTGDTAHWDVVNGTSLSIHT
jgi:hypothetical protein